MFDYELHLLRCLNLEAVEHPEKKEQSQGLWGWSAPQRARILAEEKDFGAFDRRLYQTGGLEELTKALIYNRATDGCEAETYPLIAKGMKQAAEQAGSRR